MQQRKVRLKGLRAILPNRSYQISDLARSRIEEDGDDWVLTADYSGVLLREYFRHSLVLDVHDSSLDAQAARVMLGWYSSTAVHLPEKIWILPI